MTGKVEELARALCIADGLDPDDCLNGYGGTGVETVCLVRRWQANLHKARAVLTALRTPSEGMVGAMRERVDLADWALKAVFIAAIDVLLTPKDPEQ